MRKRLLAKLRDRRGAAMVEFAFIAPLLVLMLLGIMVMGVVINAKIVVAGAAREAGRTWAIVKTDTVARTKAAEAITAGGLKWEGGKQFDPSRDVTFRRQGDYIHVTVAYRQPTLVPLIGNLMERSSGGYITLTSEATFRVER